MNGLLQKRSEPRDSFLWSTAFLMLLRTIELPKISKIADENILKYSLFSPIWRSK